MKCVKIEPNNEINKILCDNFTNKHRSGYVEVGDEKIVMPLYYESIAEEIEHFEVENTDIILTSHPKTGTTWCQEMIWMIVHNLDFEGGKTQIGERFPFLEFKCAVDYRNDPDKIHLTYESINMAKNQKNFPRLIKTHLPWSLLPKQIKNHSKKPKIIHIARNPKDTCVSYYHHCRLLDGYKGDLEEFSKVFLAGKVSWGPFWKNVLGYWERRHEPNILFIKYEDMKRDLGSVLRKVTVFLGKTLTEEQVEKLVNHLSFESMRKNPSVNLEKYSKAKAKKHNVDGSFMRIGVVGSFKVEMTPETIKKFDEWTKEHTKGTGLNFLESVNHHNNKKLSKLYLSFFIKDIYFYFP